MGARYKAIEKGIRQELETKHFLANKTICGKQYSKSFKSIRDARKWRLEFHPEINLKNSGKSIHVIDQFSKHYNGVDNGVDNGVTLRDVWSRYQESHFPSLAFSTKEVILEKSKFFTSLLDYKMCLINPDVIYNHVSLAKQKAMAINSRRVNFNHDLKVLKSVFNWYKENIDFKYHIPITRMHYNLGKIKEKKVVNKKMSEGQLRLFLKCLTPFFYDFAYIQLMIGGRVQEVAGLTFSSIDFENKRLRIENVAVWSRSTKKFVELKNVPKNGEYRDCHISKKMMEILQRRRASAQEDCEFVFHDNGKPLKYRKIQYQYNKALKLAGLDNEFSSTHILRHTMATITRKVTGSLELTQAVTGHKDQRLVQHYASLPIEAQKDAVTQVEEYFSKNYN